MKNYNQAREHFSKVNNKVMLSECELAIGRVLKAGGKCEAAVFHLDMARKLGESIGEFRVVQEATALMSKC
jgi:hypothetical protein